jgi:TadE-like protein
MRAFFIWKRRKAQSSQLSVRSKLAGSAAIEWLAAAPIVMLLGMSILQWSLLFFSRTSIEFALTQAAREGAQGNALVANIEAGLARGMIPFWGLGISGQPLDAALPAALLRLGAEKATGALVWTQIAPTEESFTDWAVPARDALGDEIASVVEIPNDALQFVKKSVGASSGQTLKDANLLKLEIRYGVPLNVPIIAPIVVRIMEQINSCPSAPTSDTVLGTIRLPTATSAEKAAGTPWACSFYRAKDATGADQLRWPVQTVAMVRMHTPARKTGVTALRKESPSLIAMAPAPGPVSSPEPIASKDVLGGAPGGAPTEVGSTSPSTGGSSGGSSSGGSTSTGGGSATGAPSSAGGGDLGSHTGGSASADGSGTGSTAGGAGPSGAGTSSGPTVSGAIVLSGPAPSEPRSSSASGPSSGPTSSSATIGAEVLARIESEGRATAIAACKI